MTKTHVVSFSGGMGSFAEALSCVNLYGKENVILFFADTLTEDEDLYRFKDEVVKYLGCELVTLCRNESVWELFKRKKFIANSRLDLCSRYLKREPLIKWLKDNYTPENVEMHLGIDFSEHHRLTRVQEKMNPWVYRSTLVENGWIIPKNLSLKIGIKPPRLYEMGMAHNNCGGFCVKAGLGQFKLLYEIMPERYKWHEQQERETLALGAIPFLRKTIKGNLNYITMEEYRTQYLMTGQAESDKWDIGGCSCSLPL